MTFTYPSHTTKGCVPLSSDVIKAIHKDTSCVSGRLVIPREIKKEILKELRIFGIAEETLFADSIDSVCKGIKGQF